jgi:hypothetical protein
MQGFIDMEKLYEVTHLKEEGNNYAGGTVKRTSYLKNLDSISKLDRVQSVKVYEIRYIESLSKDVIQFLNDV